MKMTQRTKVLLMTNSEHGQSNIFLALLHELLHRESVEVHLCSYAPLQSRFDEMLSKYAPTFPADYKSRAKFHTMRGPSMIEVSSRGGSGGPLPHKPTVAGCIDFFKALDGDVWGWTKEEFLEGYKSGKEIIESIKPDITVIDQYFIQARDAAVTTGIKYCLIESMSLFRVVGKMQKNHAWLWKYPAPGTAFPYPVPAINMVQNTYLQLRIAFKYLTSPQRKKVLQWRDEAGIKGPFAWEDEWKVDRLTLTPSTPDLDWSLDIPDNVIGCGPITLPTDYTATAHELYRWVQKGQTILINLGSLCVLDHDQVGEIACAIKQFLIESKVENLQVLWNLGSYRSNEDTLLQTACSILEDFCKSDRVKIVQWLDIDPVALLSTGKVVCTVHHGGANSWFEGLKYGVPQILLPAWFDCYDNAKRTEHLGIGIWGNKTSAPRVDCDELVESLHEIFENEWYKLRAEMLAKKLSKVEGRTLAADHILQAASPDHFVWGRMPSEVPELIVVHNRAGKTLTRVKPEERSNSR